MPETPMAIQDHYSGGVSHCYGCGRSNEHGLHLRSFWKDGEATCTFVPKPYHIGIPGFLYGGLLASLVDCHGCATAAAAAYEREGRSYDSTPPLRYITASLHVDFLRPTPADTPLELTARVKEIRGRKSIVEVIVSAAGEERAKGEVVTVPMPAAWMGG